MTIRRLMLSALTLALVASTAAPALAGDYDVGSSTGTVSNPPPPPPPPPPHRPPQACACVRG